MSGTNIKFAWSKPPFSNLRWRLGLFCTYRQAISEHTGKEYAATTRSGIYPLVFSIRIQGVIVWAGGLVLAAYMTGAAVLLRVYKQDPYNHEIRYADLAWPARWPHLRELQGQANLAQAKDQLAKGQYQPAFINLRTGLERYPADADSRIALASIHIAFRQRLQAERVIMDAFDHGYPGFDFVQRASVLLQDGDNLEGLLAFYTLAEKSFSGQIHPKSDDARIIQRAHIDTLLELNRYTEALAFAQKITPPDELLLLELKAQQAIHQNALAAAEPALKAWLDAAPNSKSAILTLIRARRMAGRIPEMQAALARLRELDPLNPGYVTFGLTEYWQAKADEQASALLETGILHFSSDATTLVMWARIAADFGRDDFLEKIETVMSDQGLDTHPLLVVKLFAQIRKRQWQQAIHTNSRLEHANFTSIRDIQQTAKALIDVCTQPSTADSSTKIILIDALTRQNAQLPFYKLAIDALLAEERTDAAMDVLTLAEGAYPASGYIISKHTQAVALQASQATAIVKAQPATPAKAADTDTPFANKNKLLSSLDNLAASGQTDAALTAIQNVRKAAPAWLDATAEAALAWREILLSAQMDDLPLLQLNLRTYLRGHPERFKPVLTQADTWFESKRQSVAVLAAREVLRARPDHRPALEAMARWAPPPSPPSPPASAAPVSSPGLPAKDTR